ncbi:fatty acid desaturase family protein [Yinghuangia seranimata]|uniref:fatty acid desaturase family protein n=1 Tax=Yinghuangia seranimata TaxID=408067 RepID=UPI00248D1675|nr:acyl-CoA desaturase [Yinghuangia seranimata]MDI2128786.1 acyl-CoA desaturase [Yinghuangia seranimata]
MPSAPTALVDDPPVRERGRRGSDFAPLLAELKAAGLMERRRAWYARMIAVNLVLFLTSWAAVLWLGDSWWQLLLAIPVALFTTRASFVGHDAGHQQIGRDARTHRALSLLHGNLLMGMSCGWWNAKHSRHHANPNHREKDPDVRVGVLVWDADQTRGRTGVMGWLTRHQARLFFPLLLLEGLNLKIGSIVALKERTRREQLVEGAVLAVHFTAYVGVLLTAMSPLKALVFALLHHALLGLHLGAAFAPNHKGMPMPEPGVTWDHLRRQVLTSRNVRGGPVTDWMLGGLNYQIEHHLVPSMPRVNLRRAQPIVRAHCARLGVPYLETGLVASYRQALGHMHDVGAPLRAERARGR